jgi:hypothetical protein
MVASICADYTYKNIHDYNSHSGYNNTRIKHRAGFSSGPGSLIINLDNIYSHAVINRYFTLDMRAVPKLKFVTSRDLFEHT